RPAAEALAFLHDRGFAHGSLKPSNILAVKDTLKISTDTVSAGDTSADLRAFAAIIVQALTQQPVTFLSGAEAGLMESLAEPFREIARNCNGDSGRPQWSATEISHWLRSRNDEAAVASIAAASASRPKARSKLVSYAIVLALIAVDQSGKVTGTTLDPGGSRYFGRLALDAARKWRFVPAGSDAPREWTLRFEITRTGTRTFPRQVVAAR